jgi:hypothetical protein
MRRGYVHQYTLAPSVSEKEVVMAIEYISRPNNPSYPRNRIKQKWVMLETRAKTTSVGFNLDRREDSFEKVP